MLHDTLKLQRSTHMSMPAENLPTQEPSPGDTEVPQLTLLNGSQEPIFNPEEGPTLMSAVEFQVIARNPALTPKHKACLVAAGILQNAATAYGAEQITWYDDGDFAETYTIAEYLASGRGNDDVDIIVEIIDESLNDGIAPLLYADIVSQADKLHHQLTVDKTGNVAAMMIRLWAVFEAEIELPSLFEKMKLAARKREDGITRHHLK